MLDAVLDNERDGVMEGDEVREALVVDDDVREPVVVFDMDRDCDAPRENVAVRLELREGEWLRLADCVRVGV